MNIFLQHQRRLTEELVKMVDNQLDDVFLEFDKVLDPDSWGYFDSAEHLSGLGFVILQNYLASVSGILKIEKKQLLEMGPKFSEGNNLFKVVNTVANFWKHNQEWALEKIQSFK